MAGLVAVSAMSKRVRLDSSWRLVRIPTSLSVRSVPVASNVHLPLAVPWTWTRHGWFSTTTASQLQQQSQSQSHQQSHQQQESQQQSPPQPWHRLSRIVSVCVPTSRRVADRYVREGHVTVNGTVITQPEHRISLGRTINESNNDNKSKNKNDVAIRCRGQRLSLDRMAHMDVNGNNNASNTINNDRNNDNNNYCNMTNVRVWLAHKVKGELVTESDVHDRPTLMQRVQYLLKRTKRKKSSSQKAPVRLLAVGRLDMATEGLMVLTNDGAYARAMELPSSALHRVYRARVHGLWTDAKLAALTKGRVAVDGRTLKPMRVELEGTSHTHSRSGSGNSRSGGSGSGSGGGTNRWVRITCTEGRNRMVRKALATLGLQVTRLIRVAYGDYQLSDIPDPKGGGLVEVPHPKPLTSHKARGRLRPFKRRNPTKSGRDQPNKISTSTPKPIPIEWIRPV